jgi:cyclophilin family peptidyl-prolyl cis-trans isomerase
MARTRMVRSGTSQFFVNVADNRRLDHTGYAPDDFGYAVFGRVIEGMDVVDQISRVRTTIKDGMENVPVDPVIIKGITVKR